MAGKRLTRAQARAALGDMPERTLARLIAEGAPLTSAAELFRWYVARAEKKAREQEREKLEHRIRALERPDWEEAERKAKAELVQMDVLERRGSLVPRVKHDKEIARIGGVLRGSISGMPGRYANRMVMLETQALAYTKLKEIERGLLGELQHAISHGADDPDEDDA